MALLFVTSCVDPPHPCLRSGSTDRLSLDGLVFRLDSRLRSSFGGLVCTLYLVFKEPRPDASCDAVLPVPLLRRPSSGEPYELTAAHSSRSSRIMRTCCEYLLAGALRRQNRRPQALEWRSSGHAAPDRRQRVEREVPRLRCGDACKLSSSARPPALGPVPEFSCRFVQRRQLSGHPDRPAAPAGPSVAPAPARRSGRPP